MDRKKLARHVRLCRRNLASKRVKCCAACPFEKEIVRAYPGLGLMFREKRRSVK